MRDRGVGLLVSLTLVGVFLCASMAFGGAVEFYPVEHATFGMRVGGVTIYVDPVGERGAFGKFSKPDLVLITDIHRDHLSVEFVKGLADEGARVVGPKAVVEQLGFGQVLNNGETTEFNSISILAMPMYNLTEERKGFHEKGRGNGYLIEGGGERIYVAGDTEDIPEMRALKNIDHALICMNLPYTMTVEQAASAVLEFKPAKVYPYHYRGKGGMSDLGEFKKLVSKDPSIEVVLLDWY